MPIPQNKFRIPVLTFDLPLRFKAPKQFYQKENVGHNGLL
jgi:hypothetical protein